MNIDKPSRPEWISINPKNTDIFTRAQIIQYLDEIPLGYRSAAEHEITEQLITRAQQHFAQLSVCFRPSND